MVLRARAASGAVPTCALAVLLTGAVIAGCGSNDVRALSAAPSPSAAAQPAPAPPPPTTGSAGATPEPTAAPPSTPGPMTPGTPMTPGAPGGSTGPAAGSASPGAQPTGASPDGANLPTAQASPVFLGEACDPTTDRTAVAVNGLVLYCGPSSDTYRWSVSSAPSPSPSAPRSGSECDPSQLDKITEGANGRPFACLREPDGSFRWSDVS